MNTQINSFSLSLDRFLADGVSARAYSSLLLLDLAIGCRA